MPGEEDRFVGDFLGENALSCNVIRSAVARGRILSVSHPRLPEGVFLCSARDVPGDNRLAALGSPCPLLASREVSYRGEAVLLLCGSDERALEAIAEEIEIRYAEEEPLVFSAPSDDQIVDRREVVVGDPDAALAEAFQLAEGEYSTGAQEHFASDPHGALVVPREGGCLVYCPTQWPFHVRRTVASALGVAEKHVEVRVTRMSAHRDSKIWFPSLVAAHAALAARKSGRAVRLLVEPSATASFTPKRAPTRVSIRTGLDREGNPVAHDIGVFVDGGAFPVLGAELLERTIEGALGGYASLPVRLRGFLVKTSSPPLDAFVGLGLSQGFFAAETHASRLAELSSTDPFTWKERNLVKTGGRLASGGTPSHYPPPELLRRVAEVSDFTRKHASYEMHKKRRTKVPEEAKPLRGIGLSVAYQGSGLVGRGEERSSSSVVARLDADGSLLILTSAVSVEGMAERAWIDAASRILGIEKKRVVVAESRTDSVPDSGPSALSRNVTIVRELVESCCNAVVRKRFRAALPIEVKRTYRPPRAGRWDEERRTGFRFPSLSWGAAVVETEVDPITLETSIRGIWTAISCGAVLDPRAARRTIENGVFHALWWCTSDHASARRPRVLAIPPISVDFLPGGPKGFAGGIEELAGSVIPSAYVSAVAQATGRYFDALPITPELVHRYTEEP